MMAELGHEEVDRGTGICRQCPARPNKSPPRLSSCRNMSYTSGLAGRVREGRCHLACISKIVVQPHPASRLQKSYVITIVSI